MYSEIEEEKINDLPFSKFVANSDDDPAPKLPSFFLK